MGIQDRDYYVDKLRELQGYTEKARFRAPLGRRRLIRRISGSADVRTWAWAVAFLMAVAGWVWAIARS